MTIIGALYRAGGPADITGRIADRLLASISVRDFQCENVMLKSRPVRPEAPYTRAAKATADSLRCLSGHLRYQMRSRRRSIPISASTRRKDFACRSAIRRVSVGLSLADRDFPASNFKEFAGYAKGQSGQAQCRYGHAVLGSVSYIGCLLLQRKAISIKPTHWCRSAAPGPCTERHARRPDRLRM